MKQTLTLLGALLLLGVGYGVFVYDRDGSSLRQEDIAFAIEDTASIERIQLTRLEKGKPVINIDLKREADGSWLINDQYPVIQPKMDQMLKVLHLVHLKEVLVGEGIQSAEKILRTLHTRVEVYDQQGIVKTYLIGTETKDATGTLVKLADAQAPYIVEMPGLQGYINASFPLEADLYRENLLFPARLSNLQRISVTYPQESDASFTLERSGDNWLLAGTEQAPNDQALQAYLGLFQGKIYAETFATEDFPGKKEALSEQTPDVFLNLSYLDGQERNVVLFARTENLNNYFGWVEGEPELLTIQRFVIDKFLRSKADFLPLSL
ncbi:MAG: hypothetical protein AAF399_18985 [Bacteroidota bacterium]